MRVVLVVAGFAALGMPCGFGQTACVGTAVTGTVRDSTQAVVPGATLSLDGGQAVVSGPDGRYRFLCVGDGVHRLAARAQGFAQGAVSVTVPHVGQVDVFLALEAVETQVEVNGDEGAAAGTTTSSGPSQTIQGKQLDALADDPDDLERELRQLAAAGGGSPANVTISVDGFQGESKVPPKSSIAYIKVNPDQFAAEYREPPFDGARVEVYTRPGQKAYHGALFGTNGSSWANARDPFSVSKGALGKQRYGFELGGPVRKAGSDFAVTLEHRSIDDVAVVNAVTLDGGGSVIGTAASVPDPQRLWLGTARVDWQVGAKNTLISTYSANVNSLQNLGVGGSTLAEAGYGSQTYEHMFRVSDITTANAHLMHEARVSFRWSGDAETPVSTAPQVQVAGAFTGGGAALGAQRSSEFEIEADDDAILTTKAHTMKFGTQFLSRRYSLRATTNFNGTYVFGGGIAPVLDANGKPVNGQTATITGLEQYRRGVLGLAGGTATAWSGVTGNPELEFTQVREALFFEDDWNVGHGVHVAYGLRYFLQNDPLALNGAVPRLGVLWSPTKDGRWTLHAHWGLFSGRFGTGEYAEVLREDGVERVTSTVYNPVYGNPLAGATAIHSVREFGPHIGNLTWGAENIGGTRTLPLGMNVSLDWYVGRIWNDTRTLNVNSPVNGVPTGLRAMGIANLNVLQVQNSGQGRVTAVFAGVENHKYKRVQFFVGGVRVKLIDDTDDSLFNSPQQAGSEAGEFAPRTNQGTWNVFGNATVTLPRKLQFSTDFNGSGDKHYNITTGFDNNGDGNFNDRPQYAAAGAPGGVATRYGLLTASGGTGVLRRNSGVMPWGFYVDANVQRAFVLTHNAKAEHQQTLTVNVRSSNVLNHLNVTQVGGVLGSPLFGVPYAADNGRRVELGARYSF